jgi:WD40 repeat protein
MATLNTCAFRPERPYRLVLGGDESVLKVYDGPPYKFSKSEKHHSGFINQMKYNSKGTYLVTVGADKKIVLYEGNKH